MGKLPYYNMRQLLSYNAVYNFAVGGRGIGKTYAAKKYAISKAIANNEQFIYLRRYNTEMVAKNTFFADIEHEFPGHSFRIMGNNAVIAPTDNPTKNTEWDKIGEFFPLSKAQSRKSVNYKQVHTIIFDEFILENGITRYLPEEVDAFNGLYSTVDRWNDRVKVFFLANAVRITNPYFLAFDIVPETGKRFYSRADGFAVFEIIDSQAFSEQVATTRFGAYINRSQFGEYALNNIFRDNGDVFVESRPAGCFYIGSVETNRGVVAIWQTSLEYGPLHYFVSSKRPRKEMIWTTNKESHRESTILCNKNGEPIRRFKSAYNTGRMRFTDVPARNIFIGLYE